MKKNIIIAISMLLLLSSSHQSLYAQKAEQRLSKIPAMFPVNESTLPFTTDDFFTFLWDKKFLKSQPLTFILVPMYEGQKAEDAIKKNRPLYTQNKIVEYYINYPWNAPSLQKGRYAWQVRSNRGKVLLTSSFAIDKKASTSYLIYRYRNQHFYLQEELDGSYQRAYDKMLLIHYNEPYHISATQGLRYRVLDERRNVIVATNEAGVPSLSTCPTVPIKTGENWVSINLASCTEYGKFYTLEVWNSKGETYYLRFICYSSEPHIGITPLN